MKPSGAHDLGKTAVFLSIALHIFCVTGAEAALSLSKKMNSDPTFTFINEIASTLPGTLSRNDNGYPSLQAKDCRGGPPCPPDLQNIGLPQGGGAPTKRRQGLNLAYNDKFIKKFKGQQSRLDQRIKSVKRQMIRRQVELLQSVGSSVYDTEKVPLEMRTSVLPAYLKQMRSRILSRWLFLLHSIECQSCTSIVEYRIDQRGNIFDLSVLKPSKAPNFDAACVKAIKQSNPLPVLPFRFNEETKSEYLTVSLTFYFEQRKPDVFRDRSTST